MTAERENQRVCLGVIIGARGLRGEVKIRSFTERPEDIAAYGPLEDETGQRQIEIRSVSVTPKAVIARIHGITDRTSAERLKGLSLYVPRDRLPPPEDADSWYYEDLVGIPVWEHGTARHLGEVVAVQNYGAGDLLEIRVRDQKDTLLLPFTRAFVPLVDVAGARIEVRLPEDF